jgi:energy-converting hydrogenase Eha subunit B
MQTQHKLHLFNSKKSLSILLISFLVIGTFIGLAQLPQTKATDSIFGYNTIGGSTNGATNTTAIACKFTVAESGESSKISIYMKGNTETINVVANIWGISGGYAGALLASSNAVSVGTTEVWTDFPLIYSFEAGTYWLGFIASGNYTYYSDAGANGQHEANYGGVTYPTVPNPFGRTDWADGNIQDSIYLTYTAGGAPTPTPSPSPTPSPTSTGVLYVNGNQTFLPNGTAITLKGMVLGNFAFVSYGAWMGADGLIQDRYNIRFYESF